MEKDQMDPQIEEETLDRLLDSLGEEAFPKALGDRIMATLPDQNAQATRPFARALAFGGSLAASLAIGISLGLSDLGQDYGYAEEDIMALAFGLAANEGEDEGEGLVEEN